MGKLIKVLLHTSLSFFTRVLIPLGFLYLIPKEISIYINNIIDLNKFIYNLIIIGIIIVVLTFIHRYSSSTSKIGLLTSIAGSITSLYFTLYVITLGNLSSMGLLYIDLSKIVNQKIWLSIEYSIIVYLFIIACLISILKSFVDWIKFRSIR
ncbi:MAG: hypothetical protein N3E39_02990 [Candidatus Methanomethylicia archaeon]|nr:hypothetical protein [Candidatus Methanomethylicia archaeon]